jgi:hypothetical protein
MEKSVPFVVALVVSLTASLRAPAEDVARDIIEGAIRVQGGKDQLERSLTFRCRLKGTITTPDSTSLPFTMEFWSQLPGRKKYVARVGREDEIITEVRIHNKDHGWQRRNDGKPNEFTGEELDELIQGDYAAYVTRLVPLLDEKQFVLSALDEAKVSDRPARVVKVVSEGHPEVRLYFDKESLLLIKSERQALNWDGKKVLSEEYYADYKDVNGMLFPMRRQSYSGGKKHLDAECTGVKFLEKIDPSEFEEPK